jgi:hypothetical protein
MRSRGGAGLVVILLSIIDLLGWLEFARQASVWVI